MNNVECAVSCFNDGFSCSQAVLATYAELFGLDRDRALKVASAFGGGMGHLGETCGAVTGAFMVIGLKCGQTEDADDKETKKKTYRLVKVFAEKFKALNGSISCTELLGCDLSTPEGMKRAKEQNLFVTLCPTFVRDAAELLEELL
jgi:C_GCAxxG_C_C family probable redox protein